MAYGITSFISHLLLQNSEHSIGPTGSRGFGKVIPANSALVFTVELVGLEPVGGRQEL